MQDETRDLATNINIPYAIEHRANQDTGKQCILNSITSTLPIMCGAYIALIALATVFSMQWRIQTLS